MLIGTHNGLEVDGQFISQIAVAELESLLKTSEAKDSTGDALQGATRPACQSRWHPPRPHHQRPGRRRAAGRSVSNEGIGTLIYANEYQGIRPAMRKDIRHITALIKPAIEDDQTS